MAFPSKITSEAIKSAAIDVLEREGEAALTLRRVAGLLGVAPNALYRYYGSREVMVAAVADEVARRLLTAINQGLDQPGLSSAADHVRTLMHVYARFAAAHPDLYRTLMTNMTAAEATLPRPLGHELLWLKVIELLEPLTGPGDAPAAAVTLWSLLHGMWVLRQADMIDDQKPDQIDAFAVAVLLKGLAS